MLIVETIAKIRRYHFVDGLGIKEISRKLRLSRNTVRKVIRSGMTEHKYERSHQPLPRLGDYVDRLDKLLEEDWKRPKKRRFTAQRLFELLQSESYSGGYDSIQRYVKKWRVNHGKTSKSAFIPLHFEPGDAYQFDWSHESVILGGVPLVVKVAHFRLSHSRQSFVVAYPRESLEMVIDAHNLAFAFFGGTCRRGIYDNMSTAVDKVLQGKKRKFNRRFAQLCSHYLVEPVACTPGAGWEKGQVERQVENIREWLFTPRPRFNNLAELNSWLVEQCQVISKKRCHPEYKDRTILEVFQDEQSSLIPTTTPFTSFVEQEGTVSSTSLVRYDRNHYSVDSKMVNNTVTVRASAERLQIVSNGEIVGEHIRDFGRGKTIYDPWHYLGILDHKPGGLRDGAPFKDWSLPTAVKQIQLKLVAKDGGDREFVAILQASQLYGLDVAEQACRQALASKTVRSEVVINLMARAVDPPAIDPVATPERFKLVMEPEADCSRYDQLCPLGGSHATH